MENEDIFLKQLLEKIGMTTQPIEVHVFPEAYATQDNCFPNVLEKVKRDGGEIIYGWSIQYGRIIIEAERHAVWKSPAGELIDITPNVLSLPTVNFVIDSTWVYTGKSVDNVRVNITDTPVVDDFILICETITKLYQTGETGAAGVLYLLEPIKEHIDYLEIEKSNCALYAVNGGTYDTPCYCDRPFSYKECHGLNLKEDMKKAVENATILLWNNRR